ncbi:hypothetical protein HPB51_017178 [Rhipicephalus microplus]|uniref:Uncharacterized protein n=1 Tax=Rhipicephalus microplus TaxID=6941 RepID=A0A9J6EAP8_RHIMP|nr:hypothetical protein HPB51_017178 [Rhipicephalus microplus]
MKEISALIGPPRWYHLVVWLLTFVRAFPSSWTQLAALFVAADVEHWCSRPSDPSFANWTEQRLEGRSHSPCQWFSPLGGGPEVRVLSDVCRGNHKRQCFRCALRSIEDGVV